MKLSSSPSALATCLGLVAASVSFRPVRALTVAKVINQNDPMDADEHALGVASFTEKSKDLWTEVAKRHVKYATTDGTEMTAAVYFGRVLTVEMPVAAVEGQRLVILVSGQAVVCAVPADGYEKGAIIAVRAPDSLASGSTGPARGGYGSTGPARGGYGSTGPARGGYASTGPAGNYYSGGLGGGYGGGYVGGVLNGKEPKTALLLTEGEIPGEESIITAVEVGTEVFDADGEHITTMKAQGHIAAMGTFALMGNVAEGTVATIMDGEWGKSIVIGEDGAPGDFVTYATEASTQTQTAPGYYITPTQVIL